MKLYDFVEWELQAFRDECNFMPDELEYFNLRAKGHSNQQIAVKMNISETKYLSSQKRLNQRFYGCFDDDII